MAKRTAEKAPQQEPELIITVDEFNRDKLGEHVARQISSFIGRKARRFGMPLHDTETLQAASECLDGYFREVSGKSLSPEMRRVIYSVRLSLNRYDKLLGIDLVSVGVEPRDKNAKTMLAADKDLRAPTLGVSGIRCERGPFEAPIKKFAVGFKVSQGAEQLQVLSGLLRARGFGIGERMPERSSVAGWTGGPSIVVCPWQRGDTVTVPAGAMVALDVSVSDSKKFDKAKLPNIFSQSERRSMQEVYFCRYLTRYAVEKMLKSPDDPFDYGVAIPPCEKDPPLYGES